MRDQAMDEEGPEPIAIVGMGCRWPGGVRDASGLWELLKNKRSGYKEFDEPRFSYKGFYHPNHERPGSMATKGGFLLDEDPRLFDPSFFGITGLELDTMDASQRKLLEVVYEAFENAGETWESVSGSSTGVFIGNFSLDHWVTQARDWDFPKPYATTGASTSILGNRISYIFNLRGPSLAIDTACSSSMYAVHLAVNAIRNGDCDSAVVAAANWIMDPSLQIALDKLGALSPTSTCHTFDASADGYARGEGFAAIYLKKLSKAVDDTSPIRSVIRGTAVNSNGRTGGITRPSADGQENVIRKAYENARLPLSGTSYFEVHGTGTPVGDPIEISAVGNAFSAHLYEDQKMLVGSVKTNLGHTEGASALAAIMKVVLSLESGSIPPSVGIETLNPAIDFDKHKVEVVTDLVPWPKNGLKRASINSFGFGGANGHCIVDHVNVVLPGYVKPGIAHEIEVQSLANGHSDGRNGNSTHESDGEQSLRHQTASEAETFFSNGFGNGKLPEFRNGSVHQSADPKPHRKMLETSPHHPIDAGKHVPIKKVDAGTRALVLLPFSAHDEQSLNMNIRRVAQVVGHHSLADVAYTLSNKRSKLLYRSFRIVERNDPTSGLETSQNLFQSSPGVEKIAFIFTGQGAQWHAMGSQLIGYHVFKTAIEHTDFVLNALPNGPTWKINDIVSGNCDKEAVNLPEISQTVCTAVQIALVDLLASWSIRPSTVLGHSSGEIAAAYAGGYITAAEAIVSAWYRGKSVALNTQPGAMLAVGMGYEKAEEYLKDFAGHIQVAAINSPESTTLSGNALEIERLSAILDAKGDFNRILRTGGNAYHSSHMKKIGRTYHCQLTEGLDYISKLGLCDKRQKYPRVPWISSVRPHKSFSTEALDASYWQSNLESPVRFSEAVIEAVDSVGVDLILEVGPHPALKGPINQTLQSLGCSLPYASTLKRKEDARVSMLSMVGTCFAVGAPVALDRVNAVDELQGGKWVTVHGCTAITLPPYCYKYGPILYNESRISKEYRLRSVLRHDLLGSKIPGTANSRPQWRNILRLKDLPWLGDHRLLPHPVFPAAGFFAMALVAASQVFEQYSDKRRIAGHSLRNVDISTALRIPEDDVGVEIVLSMELPTTSQSTDWSHFSVSSVASTSGEWTVHCTGMVKVETSDIRFTHTLEHPVDARVASSQAWYKKFADIGLGYGQMFQGLSDIQVDPLGNRAVSIVNLKTTSGTIVGGESEYPLHPASLDSIFQLGLIACYSGQIENARSAFVPIHLNSMHLKSEAFGGDHGTVIAHGELRGLRGAYATLQLENQSGELVLEIDSLRCISYVGDTPSPEPMSIQFKSPFTRLVWQPDIRMMNNTQCQGRFPPPQENVDRVHFFPAMNRFASVVLADMYETLINHPEAAEPTGNLAHFATWVTRRVKTDEEHDISSLRMMPTHDRLELLAKLYGQNEEIVEIQIAKRLHENMHRIFRKETTSVELLVHDGLLTALYEKGLFMTSAYPQLFNIFQSLGHANPSQRILELGAGTGGATRVAMKALVDGNGIKRYKDYTFTDISAGFLASARESLTEYLDFNFSVLDIEHDPHSQGYAASYDIVMASQTLHATCSIANTLANCRRLLKPGGKLVLVENTQNNDLVGIILGTLTGYWHGIPDGRTDSPFLRRDAWDVALRSSGFSGTDLVLSDYPEPHATTTVIVSTMVPPESPATVPGNALRNAKVQLLHGTVSAPRLILQLSEALERQGAAADVVPLRNASDFVSPDTRVVAYLDKSNLLLDADESQLNNFKHIISNAGSLLLLTSGNIAKGTNPDASFVPGLLRTLRTENPGRRYLSIDVDADSLQGANEDLVNSLLTLESELQEDDFTANKDNEYLWQDGCMWVSRFVPDNGLEAYVDTQEQRISRRSQMMPIDSQGPVRAAFETPGILSSLYFCPYTEIEEPLPRDWITVKVSAVGLNWKDLGLSSGRFDANNLSSEYTGIITEAGSEVVDLAVGDKIFGMGRGHFGNFTRVPAAFCSRLRPEDDLTEAATMPLVYMTAVYAFEHVTRLRKGQKVLIQSATGGLGLAAIQLAQCKGAIVYASVGTPEKAQFLTDHMKIPAERIFSSRSVNDLLTAAAAIPGGGFDVILSTSAGEMLHASVRSLAPLGHLIDVGRTAVGESMTMGLELFQKSANFSSFDLSLVLDQDPALGHDLIEAVDHHYRAGRIAPIHPFTASSVSRLDQTLLGFSKGTHIGKLVVTFEPDALVRMAPSIPRAKFDSTARFIITGGMGGLGRSIVSWMCSRGARDLIVLSRKGITTKEAQTLFDSLISRGIKIQVVACDVSKFDDVDRVVQEASSLERPVKGIVHAAVSYQDISFDKISIQRWRESMAAKVQGTRNLHKATLGIQLDFFVMTTSLESVFALATQSAYTAANVFQDAFARYRRRLGLPASTVSFGFVSDVGSLATDPTTVDMFARNRTQTITERQFIAMLEPAFVKQDPESSWNGAREDPLSAANIFTCLDPAVLAKMKHAEADEGGKPSSAPLPQWYSDPRVSLIMRAFEDATANLNGQGRGNMGNIASEDSSPRAVAGRLRHAFEKSIRAGMQESRYEDTLAITTTAVVKTIADMLFINPAEVNTTRTVADHGIDSLISAELRNWLLIAFGSNISTLDLLDSHTTISGLASKIVEGAVSRLEGTE